MRKSLQGLIVSLMMMRVVGEVDWDVEIREVIIDFEHARPYHSDIP